MRSLASTILLALIAAIACGMAMLQWQRGSFDLLFGKPATPVGETLYQSFSPEDVTSIHVSANSNSASFARIDNVWQALTPWQDRMDPMAAATIIRFSLGMRVEDLAPASKVEPSEAGLDEHAITIRLEDATGQMLAHYRIGKISSWKAEVEGAEAPISTLFIQPQDPLRDNYVYLCTGDITPLFADGLKLLRDHRPLFFNPINLRQINIHSQQGDLTLGKATPAAAWRIIKPLDLPTDVQAMQRLIEGLFTLRATNVSDRSEVTLPTTGTTTKNNSISLTRFGSDRETTLEIFPPEPAESLLANAIVSDRPDAVFDLPIKPASGMISLADLPLDVNALRDPTLTHLNIASLRSIDIIPATGSTIHITRNIPQPWQAEVDGESMLANEENLFRLLKAVTSTRAIGFESDAATDFSPWGLDRPVLQLRFIGTNEQVLELRFGFNLNGDLFVNRVGTSTVMRVDRSLLARIAIRPHEWKHSRLWSLNRVNLTDLVFKRPGMPPLMLKYDFLEESWKALRSDQDLSSTLIPSRADFMLDALEGLKVTRWLAPSDADALTALSNPELSITAMEKELNFDGDKSKIQIRTLILAPVPSGPHVGNYYGILHGGEHPFLISISTYRKLTTNLFED